MGGLSFTHFSGKPEVGAAVVMFSAAKNWPGAQFSKAGGISTDFARAQAVPFTLRAHVPSLTISNSPSNWPRGAGKIVVDHYGKVERLTKRHAEAVTDADRGKPSVSFVGRPPAPFSPPMASSVKGKRPPGEAITFDVRGAPGPRLGDRPPH